MSDDVELLRRYVAEKSDEAFAELVRRHIDLVYSVALRQVAGDTHLAEDVTQRVFAALAQKAATLVDRPALSGWLYRSAHFAASDVVRAERRRRAREQEVHAMNSLLTDSTPPADWDKVRPVLDAAIAELDEVDRDTVALRFFEGRSFAEVGAKLRLTENAARMRLERALDKLHAGLARRGVKSSVGALGLVLAQQGAMAAPAGLATTVTGVALAAGNATGAAVGAVFMSITKWHVGVAAALALAGTWGFVVQARSNADLRGEIARLRNERVAVAPLRAENARLATAAVEAAALRPADDELARLQGEAQALQVRMRKTVQTQQELDIVYESSMLTRNVQGKSQSRITYPPELLGTGMAGTVILDLVVDANGTTRRITVEKSLHPALDAAAIDSISRWKFEPGRRGDTAVHTHMRIPIGFKDPGSEVKK